MKHIKSMYINELPLRINEIYEYVEKIEKQYGDINVFDEDIEEINELAEQLFMKMNRLTNKSLDLLKSL